MDLKKLRDMEITPSERANELFRSRMKQLHPPEKKVPGVGYFATAAAVMLALGLLFVLRFTPEKTAAVLPGPGQTSAPQSEASASGTPRSGTHQPGTPQPGTPQPGAPQPDIERNVAAPEKRLPAESSPTAGVQVAQMTLQENEAPAVHQPVELTKAAAPELKRLSPQIRYHYQRIELTDFALLDVHREIEWETAEPGPATLAAETPLPLLARVIREVKYVVNGDKPDLDRAGIKPAATAFAYNQNGLLAHESRQVKQGIDKFKEMFKTE